jgi:hypothetical protein
MVYAMENVRRHNANEKKYLLLVGLIFMLHNVFGEIKNGYAKDIILLNESLKNLRAIVNESDRLTVSRRRQLESKIANLENCISYYKVTESLLNQFKMIAPDLYAEIDTIRDGKGRAVDVYIKFVPINSTELQAWGTTYINQSETDSVAYCSEYGEYAVSVKIWIVNRALIVLSHELGHVKYQVPNLASYLEYYKEHYSPNVDGYDILGHKPDDPSGKSAIQFERRFRKEYSNFLRMGNEKIEDPLAIMDAIRKNIDKNI